MVCGATQDNLAKVRLLLKTATQITVYDDGSGVHAAYQAFLSLAAEQKIKLVQAEPSDQRLADAVMGYIGWNKSRAWPQAIRKKFMRALNFALEKPAIGNQQGRYCRVKRGHNRRPRRQSDRRK